MIKYIVIIGAIVQLYGIFFYIKETLRGDTKPNKVTWLMWSVAPLIATAAGLADGVSWAVLPVFMSGFGPLLVFLASFINPNAYWKLERLDYICGFLSVLALILWVITKEPIVAIVFAMASDAAAAVPTLIKCWKHPETESDIAYSTGLFNSLTSFAAIRAWAFSEYAFAMYLVIMNSLLFSAINRIKLSKLFITKQG